MIRSTNIGVMDETAKAWWKARQRVNAHLRVKHLLSWLSERDAHTELKKHGWVAWIVEVLFETYEGPRSLVPNVGEVVTLSHDQEALMRWSHTQGVA